MSQERSEAFFPNLAASLNNLANLLRTVGRREEALARAHESVSIYRQLAQRRPDAFLPDLARSLAVRGGILAEVRPGEALESLAEAMSILTPFFSQLPRAYAPLMKDARDSYLSTAQSAGVAPDSAILDPVTAIFEKLNSPEQK